MEQSYDALKKYTRDLTEAARDGKLDPVIGGHEEIGRVVQVLSRRTKNNPVLIGELPARVPEPAGRDHPVRAGLTRAHEGIIEIQLRRLEALLEERKIALDISDAAKRWLAEAGYDPVYGARPLKRTIQKSLQDPLARMILEGRIGDRATVTVDAGESGLLIDGAAVPLAA